jgi:PhnB protein
MLLRNGPPHEGRPFEIVFKKLGKRRAKMLVQPYLMFGGRCQEAIDFYQKALGAELLMLMRFKEAPEAPPPGMMPDNWGDKVMHSAFKVGDTLVMASDGCATGDSETKFQGVSLALTVANPAEAEKKFAALSQGGNVTMPLTKTFFSPSFGTLNDRFGVSWMVVVSDEAQAAKAA